MGIVVYQVGVGGPDVFEVSERAEPDPQPGTVRIRNEAIGLNYLEALFRRGTFPPPALPFVSGVEGAGIITALGSGVSNFEMGDRVGYLNSMGAYAADRLASPADLVRLPDDIPASVAARFMAKGLTARMALKQAYDVQPGQLLIVTGGAGAVASIITRWAVALGARVLAVVGTAEKVAAAQANGAAEVIVGFEDLRETAHALSDGVGADAALDAVGGRYVDTLVSAVRDGGAVVSYGNAAGQSDPDRTELIRRSISFSSPPLAQFVHGPAQTQGAVDDLFEVVRASVLDSIPVVERPLADIRDVHADLDARRSTGITVLIP